MYPCAPACDKATARLGEQEAQRGRPGATQPLPAAAPLAEQLRFYFFVFVKKKTKFPAHTDSHLFPPLSDPPRPRHHLLRVNFTGMLFQSITAQKSQLVRQSSPGRM